MCLLFLCGSGTDHCTNTSVLHPATPPTQSHREDGGGLGFLLREHLPRAYCMEAKPHNPPPTLLLFAYSYQLLKSWVCPSGAKSMPEVYRNGRNSWRWKNRDRHVAHPEVLTTTCLLGRQTPHSFSLRYSNLLWRDFCLYCLTPNSSPCPVPVYF